VCASPPRAGEEVLAQPQKRGNECPKIGNWRRLHGVLGPPWMKFIPRPGKQRCWPTPKTIERAQLPAKLSQAKGQGPRSTISGRLRPKDQRSMPKQGIAICSSKPMSQSIPRQRCASKKDREGSCILSTSRPALAEHPHPAKPN